MESNAPNPDQSQAQERALGNSPSSEFVDTTALVPSTESPSSDEVAPENNLPESERKKITDNNTKILKKRFGEEFLKGERLDSGEYAGGGARELLQAYMEIAGFAEELKRIIPNPHQALATLRDNQNYIRAVLEDRYKDDSSREKEIPMDPFELARQKGYELTGPFEDVESFAGYADDFRPGERICTYNDPDGRLSTYHIMWLRHEEVDAIVPADELTQDKLTKPWQDYLKAIGRYDPATDSYNLDDLQPAREDPYGTSSMSVQISRRGNHVSIKNRYNHTVTSPDSTYQNNLDNIAYGLKLAIYTDNDGGIHGYYQETNNIYLGHFEYIENGVVKTIDKGAYDMLAPDLYISKNGKGETIQLGNRSGVRPAQTSFETQEDGTKNLHIYNEDGELQQTYRYTYDDKNKISGVALTIAEGAKTEDICRNPALTELTIATGAKTENIYNNPALTELTIAAGAKTGNIHGNPALTELTIAEGAETRSIFDNPALTELTIAERVMAGIIYRNPALTELTIAEGAKTEDICSNPALTELTIATGAKTESIYNNPALTELTIAEGAKTEDIFNNHPNIVITRGTKL